MANTYTLIASNILSVSASSVTFNSIPNTYTDLIVQISTRGSLSSAQSILVSFNGVPGGTAYSNTEIVGEGSSAFSQRTSLYYAIEGYNLQNDTTTTANTFNSVEYYIPNYAISQKTPVSSFGVKENNNATVNVIEADAGLWSDTSAITSVVFYPASGLFVSGSSFYLYGIKNS